MRLHCCQDTYAGFRIRGPEGTGVVHESGFPLELTDQGWGKCCGGHGLPNRRGVVGAVTLLTRHNPPPKGGGNTIPPRAPTPPGGRAAEPLLALPPPRVWPLLRDLLRAPPSSAAP